MQRVKLPHLDTIMHHHKQPKAIAIINHKPLQTSPSLPGNLSVGNQVSATVFCMNQAASQESQIEATGSKVYSVFSHPSNAFFHGSELFSHASNL